MNQINMNQAYYVPQWTLPFASNHPFLYFIFPLNHPLFFNLKLIKKNSDI
jgi:hypothetical protein